jgi:hypothetical protein
VCAYITSTQTKRTFMKYDTGEFYGELSFHVNFRLHWTLLTITSREHLAALLSVGMKSRIPAPHSQASPDSGPIHKSGK